MARREATFQVERFDLVPAPAGTAVIELEGRWLGNDRVPGPERVLVVERGEERLRCQPLPAPRRPPVREGEPWAATFAAPLESVSGEAVVFLLETGTGLAIELPSPRRRAGEAAADPRTADLERALEHLRAERSELERRVEEEQAGRVAAERRAEEEAAMRADAQGRLRTDEERVRAGTTELKRRIDVLAGARTEAERRAESALAELRSLAAELDEERGRRADAEAAASELADLLKRARANRMSSPKAPRAPRPPARPQAEPRPPAPQPRVLERAAGSSPVALRAVSVLVLGAIAVALLAIVSGAVRLPI
jgi:hypothetical protein